MQVGRVGKKVENSFIVYGWQKEKTNSKTRELMIDFFSCDRNYPYQTYVICV